MELEKKQEVIDIPFKTNKRQKGVKNEVKERRDKILKIIERIGYRNTIRGIKELAKLFKTSERSVYRDFNWIKGNFKPTDIQEIKITLGIARDKALNMAFELSDDDEASKEDKAKSIDALMKTSRYYREELEGWGEKQKVADKLDHSGSINLRDTRLMEIYNEEYGDKAGGSSKSLDKGKEHKGSV